MYNSAVLKSKAENVSRTSNMVDSSHMILLFYKYLTIESF